MIKKAIDAVIMIPIWVFLPLPASSLFSMIGASFLSLLLHTKRHRRIAFWKECIEMTASITMPIDSEVRMKFMTKKKTPNFSFSKATGTT